MPTRETRSPQSPAARLARDVQRLLRRLFVDDLGMKLLALVITLGLWYAVTGQRATTTIRLRGVPVEFRIPSEMEISNDPRSEVDVVVTGNKRALDRVNVRDLVLYVDATTFRPGEHFLNLSVDRVSLGLPEGATIRDIEPGRVPLEIEPREERLVEVEAKLTGTLPEGREVYGVTVTPARIRLRGPASHVRTIQKAITVGISLDGRFDGFATPNTAIDISDTKVFIVESFVNVFVDIGEQRKEKTFTGIRVSSSTGAAVHPLAVSVTVYGAKSALDALRAEDISIVLNGSAASGFSPTLSLKSGTLGRFELKSVRPSNFAVRP